MMSSLQQKFSLDAANRLRANSLKLGVRGVGEDLWSNLPHRLSIPVAAGVGALLTVASTILGQMLASWLPSQGVSLIFLLTILLGAVAYGIATGMAAAVLSFFAYNFFFIAPTYTFTIADPREIFALFVFFGVALITGSLAGRMRDATDRARARAGSLHSLNEFAGNLSGAVSERQVIDALAAQAVKACASKAVVLMKVRGELKSRSQYPDQQSLEGADMQAAARCLRNGEAMYPSAPGWPGAQYEFHPITSSLGCIGVLGILRPGEQRVSMYDINTLETMLRHASIALDRLQLQSESASVRDEAERERLRSAILSSLSHDLKTPLASILGSVTSLREFGTKLDEATRADLLSAIEEETVRLSQFVVNLLDLTRLEAETPDLRRDWLDAGDAVNAAVSRAKRMFPGATIEQSISPFLPLIKGDAILLEHVVFNILDNAVKYSPAGARVKVDLAERNGSLVLNVADAGRGIPQDKLHLVFDKFFRGDSSDHAAPGTGLGLTLCKRIVEGMAGTIEAESPAASGHGTMISITMPIPKADAVVAQGDERGIVS